MKYCKYPKVISFTGVLCIPHLSIQFLRDYYRSITLFLHHRLRAEGKTIISDPRPSAATGGNQFPPLDHRGCVILNLRLLLWHGGMSPLRIQNTHSHAQTHTFRLHTHTNSHTYQTEKYIPQREREKEIGWRGLLQPGSWPPFWCLKVMGWLLVISVKASGSLELRVLWFIDSLISDTHTQTHSPAH